MTQPAKIAVFVSFDYELFLGRNFVDDEQVLFGPTAALLDACDGRGVKTTYFADVCSVWAHAAAGQTRYVQRFEQQLRECLDRNHDVQLHIHPHWLGVQFSAGGGWQIDAAKTNLADFGFSDGADASPAILRRGVAYLEDLLRPVRSDYRCCAFRAGGLVLQPHEAESIAALAAAGLAIDSTVAPGMVAHSELGEIDYAQAPRRSHWRVNADSGLTREAPTGMLELPIATYRMDWPKRIGFLMRRARAVGQARGSSITRSARQSRLRAALGLVRANLRYLGSDPVFLLSCDTKGFDVDILMAGVKQWVSARPAEEVISVVMICHPKLMFAQQVALLEAFIDQIRRNYPGVVFATMNQAQELLRSA